MLLDYSVFQISVFFLHPLFESSLNFKYGKIELVAAWNFLDTFKLTIKRILQMWCSCFCQSYSPSLCKRKQKRLFSLIRAGGGGHGASLSLGSPQDGSIETERRVPRATWRLKTIPVQKGTEVLHAVLGCNIEQAKSTPCFDLFFNFVQLFNKKILCSLSLGSIVTLPL